MECSLVKPGYDCNFMTKSGCGFGAASETCHEVVAECEGCERVHDWPGGKYCMTFASPASKWATGICNFATHKKVERAQTSKKINPLKASKKAAAGKE